MPSKRREISRRVVSRKVVGSANPIARWGRGSKSTCMDSLGGFFVGLLLFQMVGWIFKAGVPGQVASALSIHQHSENFTNGILASTDVVFFLLFTVFFLFLTAQVLDARRWRA